MKHSKILPGPTTLFGWEINNELVQAILDVQPERLLIVVDPSLERLEIFHDLLDAIRQSNVSFDQYSDITPEPTLETAEKLIAFARLKRYSIVIGIGGGSALDLAKVAAVFAENEGDLSDFLNLTGHRKPLNKGLYKILIPTTSGTGSEVTDIAVLSLATTKDVIAHEFLQADLAIVDPKLTVSVPSRVTASTGADALTHAIEAYLSVNSTPYSDALALESIRLISNSLLRAVKGGEDKEARIAMSYGSYLAGIAFYNAGVGAVHALAYPLGGEFHMAHGDSNAVMLPYVLDYVHIQCANRLHNILRAMEGGIAQPRDSDVDREMAMVCVRRLEVLMGKIGIPQTLQGFGVPEKALRSLASAAVKQKRLLARCPVHLSEEAIHDIYHNAFQGNYKQQELG